MTTDVQHPTDFASWLKGQYEYKNWYYSPGGPGDMAVPFALRAFHAGLNAHTALTSDAENLGMYGHNDGLRAALELSAEDVNAWLVANCKTDPPRTAICLLREVALAATQQQPAPISDVEIKASHEYSVTRDKGCFHAGAKWAAQQIAQQQPPSAPEQPSAAAWGEVQWPKSKDVGRIGDMSPKAFMRVGLDGDNDVYVSVCDENGDGGIEFCTPGPGGGKSSHTRVALIALMVAMEADNAEDPGRDWWAKRIGASITQATESTQP